MKRINLAIVLIMTILVRVLAHDYQTFYSDRIAYFNNKENNIKCLRIDSIKFKNDSILYPFKNIQQQGYDCFNPKGASWIGEKIIIKNDFNLFFNRNNDTIKIKTDAKLNETWTTYELKDSIKIIAEVIKYDTFSFIGILDSVKTICFQVFNNTMDTINHELNNKTILISKNNGIIKTFSFLFFPDYNVNDYFNDSMEEFSLIGLSKPNIGIQNLTWMDVNDFKVGDELHISYEYSDWYTGSYGYSTSQKTKLKYIFRQDFKDSIIYKIDREQSTFRRIVKWDSTSFDYIHDTIISRIIQDSLFDKLPGEPIVSENEAYTYSMTNGINILKTKPSIYGVIWSSGDSCWHIPIADGCFADLTYIKGLGGPYYSCSNAFSIGGEDNQLVYYKKGMVIWGNPLIITGITKDRIDEVTIVYPNPVKEGIWIKTEFINLPCLFELIDLKGELIMKKEINSDKNSISLGNINKGIYLYKLIGKNKMIKIGKIIKI